MTDRRGLIFCHKDGPGFFMVMVDEPKRVVISPIFPSRQPVPKTYDYSSSVFNRYFYPARDPPTDMAPPTLGRFDIERLRRWSRLR